MKLIIITIFLFGVALKSGAQVISLEGRWKFHVGDNTLWAEKYFNDTQWESIHVPSTWEDQGFHGYDGFAWYRIKFDGRKLNKSEKYYINLGFIDDADEVYFNGDLIGLSGQMPPKFKTAYNNERKYVIPSHSINFSGQNTIAVRVFDAMHGGGIVDGSIGIYSLNESKKMLLDLQGIWLFALSNRGERIVNEKEWRNIMVPSPWEHQGYYKYDGFAWYKRTFAMSEDFPNNDLVLILGKIDDFDKVYLNGRFIGSTNDNRPYGRSLSFLETRVYTIPQGVLQRNSLNTLEVLVHDLGNVGGIYEGPVGITTRSNYEKYFKK